MDALHVECLRCGDVRVLFPAERHRLDGGECPRCSYVGWAASTEVDEALRRRLRARPLERRRLRAA